MCDSDAISMWEKLLHMHNDHVRKVKNLQSPLIIFRYEGSWTCISKMSVKEINISKSRLRMGFWGVTHFHWGIIQWYDDPYGLRYHIMSIKMWGSERNCNQVNQDVSVKKFK